MNTLVGGAATLFAVIALVLAVITFAGTPFASGNVKESVRRDVTADMRLNYVEPLEKRVSELERTVGTSEGTGSEGGERTQ